MKCFIKDEELFMPAQVVFYFLCGQKPQWYLKSFSAFRMIVVHFTWFNQKIIIIRS